MGELNSYSNVDVQKYELINVPQTKFALKKKTKQMLNMDECI